ncbi:mCG58383 [Mus musculus]|nr:mCG58383 [Mus musculus]
MPTESLHVDSKMSLYALIHQLFPINVFWESDCLRTLKEVHHSQGSGTLGWESKEEYSEPSWDGVYSQLVTVRFEAYVHFLRTWAAFHPCLQQHKRQQPIQQQQHSSALDP